jgi:hypothetical protein
MPGRVRSWRCGGQGAAAHGLERGPPAGTEITAKYLDPWWRSNARRCSPRATRCVPKWPGLFTAQLRAIHLDILTLALVQKAVEVRGVLLATRTEMLKMHRALDKQARNTATMSNMIEPARRRTIRTVAKLRGEETMEAARANELFELDTKVLAEEA